MTILHPAGPPGIARAPSLFSFEASILRNFEGTPRPLRRVICAILPTQLRVAGPIAADLYRSSADSGRQNEALYGDSNAVTARSLRKQTIVPMALGLVWRLIVALIETFCGGEVYFILRNYDCKW